MVSWNHIASLFGSPLLSCSCFKYINLLLVYMYRVVTPLLLDIVSLDSTLRHPRSPPENVYRLYASFISAILPVVFSCTILYPGSPKYVSAYLRRCSHITPSLT